MSTTCVSSGPFTEEDLKEMVLRLAHEIRNPLATIKSAVQLIEHLQPPEGEVVEFHATIHSEIDRIDKVVRDMQRFIRLDGNEASVVRIADVVALAVETIASRRDTGVEVVPGPEARVLVDEAQLEAALVELVDNSTRLSPPEGAVTVMWECLDNGMVAVSVEDRGPGIAPAEASRILRPFYSTSTQGTGLGLNIVLRTAQILGGTLEWSNRSGGGACFTISIPRL